MHDNYYCSNPVITSHKITVSNGSIASFYWPHWLTGRYMKHVYIFTNYHGYLRAPTVAEGLKTISAPLIP